MNAFTCRLFFSQETPKQEINASLQKSSLQAKIKRQVYVHVDIDHAR